MTVRRSGSLRLSSGSVSTIALVPDHARAILVLAHGAGAGMRHPFMESIAKALSQREVASLRFQFPYMEAGKRRTDPAAVAEDTIRAAIDHACSRFAHLPCFAGGKSFGGRMSSQACAHALLPSVRGLVFFGFPLHRSGDASDARADHLREVAVPMLFLQGTRDELAELSRMRKVAARLGERATLHVIEEANHSFEVPKRTGRTRAEILEELASTVSSWMEKTARA